MFCNHCGKEVMNEAVICPHCGCALKKDAVTPSVEDKVSVGLMILSILIPLIGIILWPVKHKETPKAAMAYGLAGIISWAVAFVLLMSI